jgi:hypothetical protein
MCACTFGAAGLGGCSDDQDADHSPTAAGAEDSAPQAGQTEAPDPPERISEWTVMVESVLYDAGGETDNSACLVCHIDFEEESLAATHLEAGIVCAACHGFSGDHRGDELNIITPDVMFGRAQIIAFCEPCHPTHRKDKPYADFVKTWYGKRRPNGRMVLRHSVCTDCHGNHAILLPEQQVFE